jgi:hypothetical protein
VYRIAIEVYQPGDIVTGRKQHKGIEGLGWIVASCPGGKNTWSGCRAQYDAGGKST